VTVAQSAAGLLSCGGLHCAKAHTSPLPFISDWGPAVEMDNRLPTDCCLCPLPVPAFMDESVCVCFQLESDLRFLLESLIASGYILIH
jgi:hypothetical protein